MTKENKVTKNNTKQKIVISTIFLLIAFMAFGGNIVLEENFENSNTKLNIVGRGNVRIENGVLKTKDAYAVFGDTTLRNYRATFRARVPENAEQVQIWVGFRHHNRFDRYVVGLKGGLQNNIEVFRMGYMGADELLDIQPLDFNLKAGEWYEYQIQVFDGRIRIFIIYNDSKYQIAFLDIYDKNFNLAPNGGITLGGSWIENEFYNLQIEKLNEDVGEERRFSDSYWDRHRPTPDINETKRKEQVSNYQPKKIEKLPSGRQEFSLNGDWLFLPNPTSPPSEGLGEAFHIMSVPNFWNPSRIWLHGETMNDGKFPKGVSDKYYWQETARCEAYTFDYRNTNSALYRQYIDVPKGIENKVSELVFDAVSKMADVYVNGVKVASHIGMFGEIRVDVSKYLHAGSNTIDVLVTRLKNADGATDMSHEYYQIARIGEGSNSNDEKISSERITNDFLKDIAHGFFQNDPAGIWQPVRLIISDKMKVEDVFIKPSLDGATFEVEIKNHFTKDKTFNLKTVIVDKKTKEVLYQTASEKKKIKAGEAQLLNYSVAQLQPKLWSPADPNLYDFNFIIEKDTFTVVSGFRTFEAKDGLLYLNGKPYWLRGANHTPFALAPNDEHLADGFYQLMKAGNMQVTRTHTTPYNKLWIDAADRNGIGISHEGTYPWLMIHDRMPDSTIIQLWADEYISLLKKYRNHPSILFWTVNNEMKFYDNEPDFEKRKVKMYIIESVVKRMREIDPTRPISFDSNYRRREDIFGKDFYKNFDDGDIDDVHTYINWYDHTIFKYFNGEFQKHHLNEGRPLINQEMSTGYPNNETGHATRFYTLVHQNPQSLIGYQAYPYANPDYFLKTQSFITGEMAEALRRTCDKSSGNLHFALLTWFRNVYDVDNIEPYPTYYAMKRAMQPVLVSAELWGRHFYAGEKIPVQIYVVNDKENGEDLQPTVLEWIVENKIGKILVSGKNDIPAVKYYGRYHFSPEIVLPQILHSKFIGDFKLKVKLSENGNIISENEYNIKVAGKIWTQDPITRKKIVTHIMPGSEIDIALNELGVKRSNVISIEDALKAKADILIFDNLQENDNISAIRNYIAKGGKIIILNNEEAVKKMFPEYITGWFIPTEGDIVNMEVPESPVFNDIDVLDLRYFNNNKREIPTVCHAAYQINRNPNVEELASHIKIHGYVEGDMQARVEYMKKIKGFTLLKITEGKGSAIISSMLLEKAVTDPIAGKLLMNCLTTD